MRQRRHGKQQINANACLCCNTNAMQMHKRSPSFTPLTFTELCIALFSVGNSHRLACNRALMCAVTVNLSSKLNFKTYILSSSCGKSIAILRCICNAYSKSGLHFAAGESSHQFCLLVFCVLATFKVISG